MTVGDMTQRMSYGEYVLWLAHLEMRADEQKQ
jgi:hypothetical protein